ncbi:hypothetical protein ACET3Z_010385 [Daucus carota]
MEFGSAGAGGGSGDDHYDAFDPYRRKKRYHRHTADQIQKLEGIFKEFPHPDEKMRLQLSRELGLSPRQIKFWFQNRRTQMKAQHERADNCALRSENDKIRCENIAIREALRNVICPSCGGLPGGEDPYFDEQKLRIQNSQLKEELDRISNMAGRYIGRPISQLPPVQPFHISSLDLSMGSFGFQGMPGPSFDLDLLPGSSSNVPNIPYQRVSLTDMDKSLMADIAGNSMGELIRLLQSNEPFWMKSIADGKEVLNLESYERIFPRINSHLKNPNVHIEASRDSGVVIMNGLALVNMFMDSNKWVELFPTIVSRAATIEVISSERMGSQSGSLQLMYQELQVLSPLVPTRQFCFLRFCQQIEQGSWALVDVSNDLPQNNTFTSQCQVQRLPSGCLIQDMPNGYSKVSWMEHMEVEDKVPIHRLYRDHIYSGFAFGAERWISTLQRSCERIACSLVIGPSIHDIGGGITSPDGKRSMMKLSQRMVNNFCSIINLPNSQQWTALFGTDELEVRASIHKFTNPGQSHGMVLSAATTIWLPVPSQIVFNFFKDERTRAQWDVLSDQNPVHEVAHIANGSHPGNCISVLRAFNTSQSNMLVLQESCIDSSGSLVVYSPVDLHSINIAMSGEDPSFIPLLPSGFTISPDGKTDISQHSKSHDQGASSSSATTTSGSLLTIVIQIMVSHNMASSGPKMSQESVNTVNNLMGNTVQQIKVALNCSSC